MFVSSENFKVRFPSTCIFHNQHGVIYFVSLGRVNNRRTSGRIFLSHFPAVLEEN